MYGTLDGFRSYALARGNSAPKDATDENATAALVRASDHIQYGYVNRFHAGCSEASDAVVPAAYEAAILELATPGFFSRTYTPGEAKVLTEVKGIKWTVVGGSSTGNEAMTPVSTRIEAMLAPCLEGKIGAYVV